MAFDIREVTIEEQKATGISHDMSSRETITWPHGQESKTLRHGDEAA